MSFAINKLIISILPALHASAHHSIIMGKQIHLTVVWLFHAASTTVSTSWPSLINSLCGIKYAHLCLTWSKCLRRVSHFIYKIETHGHYFIKNELQWQSIVPQSTSHLTSVLHITSHAAFIWSVCCIEKLYTFFSSILLNPVNWLIIIDYIIKEYHSSRS